jgi:ribose 1,5-bisphosphokinase PhnN
VCPRCHSPSQNIGDLLILEPPALFSLGRYETVASWHRVGARGGRSAGAVPDRVESAAQQDHARLLDLALSLIKRAADLVLGVPGLVALQILEGERLMANFSRREAQPRTSLDLQSEGHRGTT